MSCSLCHGEEVVRIRDDYCGACYPCPECRIAVYHIAIDVTGFELSQCEEGKEFRIEEIKRTLRDQMVNEMFDTVGEVNHDYNEPEDRHKISARVRVVLPLKKGD